MSQALVQVAASGVALGLVWIGVARASSTPPSLLLPIEQAWAVNLGGVPSAAPAVAADLAFVPLRSGQLVAVTLTDGKTLWTVERPTNLPPVADSGTVFVSGATELNALDAASGRLRWQTPLGGPASAPLVLETGWLVVALASEAIAALRAADGREIWRREIGTPVVARPAVGGDRLFVPLEDGRVLTLNLHTGETIWERRLGGSPQEILPLDALFVGSTDNFFYRLRLRDGAVEWRWRTGGDIVGSAVVDAARVYFASMDNVLRALDRSSGTQRWQSPLAGRPASGPTLVDGLLVVAGVGPEIRVIEAETGRLFTRVTAPGELAAPPLVVLREVEPTALVVAVTGDGRLLALRRAVGPPLVAVRIPIGQPVFSADVPLVPVAEALRRLQTPPPPAQTAAPPPSSPGFTVQVGALGDRTAALALTRRLTDRGFAAYLVEPEPTAAARLYRVRVGHVADRRAAQQLADRLVRDEGLETFIVAVP